MKQEWIYDQFSGIDVNDARLQARAVAIGIGCAERPEESLAGRFEEWADLKATYRFFSNPKITHPVLQQPHYHQVLEKARWSQETVLFIQALARLGGFIGRKSDGEPGWQTIWKGYRRLQDMWEGATLGLA